MWYFRSKPYFLSFCQARLPQTARSVLRIWMIGGEETYIAFSHLTMLTNCIYVEFHLVQTSCTMLWGFAHSISLQSSTNSIFEFGDLRSLRATAQNLRHQKKDQIKRQTSLMVVKVKLVTFARVCLHDYEVYRSASSSLSLKSWMSWRLSSGWRSSEPSASYLSVTSWSSPSGETSHALFSYLGHDFAD